MTTLQVSVSALRRSAMYPALERDIEETPVELDQKVRSFHAAKPR